MFTNEVMSDPTKSPVKTPTTALELAEVKLLKIKDNVKHSLSEVKNIKEELKNVNEQLKTKLLAAEKKVKSNQAGLKATQKTVKRLKDEEASGHKRELRKNSNAAMGMSLLSGLSQRKEVEKKPWAQRLSERINPFS